MNEFQEKFFNYLADIQETCVQSCMTQHNMNDDNIESMLYKVTGEYLKEKPNIELHDQTERYLKTE